MVESIPKHVTRFGWVSLRNISDSTLTRRMSDGFISTALIATSKAAPPARHVPFHTVP